MKADEVHGKLESRLSALERRSDMKAIKGTTTEAKMVQEKKENRELEPCIVYEFQGIVVDSE